MQIDPEALKREAEGMALYIRFLERHAADLEHENTQLRQASTTGATAQPAGLSKARRSLSAPLRRVFGMTLSRSGH